MEKVDNDHESLEIYLQKLQSAASDNDKFAALLYVAKVAKAENCDAETRRKIFEAIGFSFISRLLKSVEVPEGCPKNIFRSIGSLLLSCFCTVDDLIISPGMLDLIPSFNAILETDLRESDNELTDKQMIDESYRCLSCIVLRKESRMKLIECGTVNKVCSAYLNDNYGAKYAMDCILSLAHFQDDQLWLCNKQGCLALLNKLSEDFKNEKGERKFYICDLLATIVVSIGPAAPAIEHSPWTQNIRAGLEEILSSKLGQDQRDPALKLVSSMFESMGTFWSLEGENKKFFSLVVNLVCVEVRIIMEGPPDQIPNKTECLINCYRTLEYVIGFLIASEENQLKDSVIVQLHKALVEAFNGILFFLKEASTNKKLQEDSDLMFATLRVLGAWMAEETQALRDEINEVLPFLMELCAKDMHTEKKDKDQPDCLRFMLPAFCHLTVEDNSRQILLENDIVELLAEYFSLHQKLLRDNKAKESETTLSTICSVFHNLILTEPSLVRDYPIISDLIRMVMQVNNEIAGNLSSGLLTANLSVFGLLCLRRGCPVHDSLVNDFFNKVIMFLKDGLQYAKKPGAKQVKKEITWEEISELWMVCMQEFCHLMAGSKLVNHLATEGGLLATVVQFIQAQGNMIPDDLKPALEVFLCAAGRLSPDNKALIRKSVEQNIINISSLGFTRLQNELQKNQPS